MSNVYCIPKLTTLTLITALLTLGAIGSKPVWAAAEGRLCGTIAGIQCDKGLWCEHDANSCNVADAAGVCIKPPGPDHACPLAFIPSCGCDGKTYPGDCERRKERVQKHHSGHCKGDDKS